MKRRRGYFKHYNDASLGQSLSRLSRNKHYLAICLFWFYLEQANAQNQNGYGEIDIEIVCGLYNIKKKVVMRFNLLLNEFVTTFKLISNDFKICFEFSNYAEYQETRGQKTRKNDAKKDAIKDNILNIKDEDEKVPPSHFSDAKCLENSFSKEVIEFKKILEQIKILNRTKVYVPELLEIYGKSVDQFKESLASKIMDFKKKHGYDEDRSISEDLRKNYNFQNYLCNCIGKEVKKFKETREE